MYGFMGLRRASVLLSALLGLLALPAAAQARPPWPCVLADETYAVLTPVEGQPMGYDASCSEDFDGHDLVNFEWDFDGDGTFEESTGASPYAVHTWTDRSAYLDGMVNFGLRVTDSAGESDFFHWPVRITDAINSWFRWSPELVNPGDVLALNAYTTPETAGTTLTYEWDLDGDGAFETSTGVQQSASLVAPDTLGFHVVGLRVSDDLGNVSTIRRRIEVLERHPSRDMLPWVAPANLVNEPPPSDTPPLFQVETPVAPTMPTLTPDTPAPVTKARRPRLSRIDANRNGLAVRYVGGPRWSRWKMKVRLPAERAAQYGLPRRTIILARGTLVLGASGAGTVRMHWTNGAYRMFRKVPRGLVDIVGRRVA